jgi:hypothetical protein
MATYKEMYMRYMDSKGIKYSDLGDHRIRVTYNGDNLKSIPVLVAFDKDGENMVQFFCWEIAKFKDKFADGILVCNDMNTKYRWVKYYIDKDNDIVCAADTYLYGDWEECGKTCHSMVMRVVNITDEAYPEFMKALYN